MKQTKILCTIGLSVMLLGGCGRQDQSQIEYIGAQKARELALEAAELTASDVTFSETDLANRSGKDYYLVNFTAAGQDYQYDIDALTGIVIESRLPSDSFKKQNEADTESANSSGAETTASIEKQTESDSIENDKNSTNNKDAGIITAREANAKALTHAGLSDSQVTIVKSKLEYDDGRQIYDVEFYSEDYEEYDYEIDAVTGEVISFDYDVENKIQPGSAGVRAIDEDEAKKLALDRVPGADSGDIWEFEVDKDDGRIEYEGKILYGGMEYEFEIDAYSGTFRSWEAEPADENN